MINVYSEIGNLKQVLVHRPGNEIMQVHPYYLSEMLFEDTPYLPIAQKEHDMFTKILKENGTEVLFLRELITDALQDDKVKTQFIKEFLGKSNIPSKTLEDKLQEYYLEKSHDDFIEAVFCGIRKDDEQFKEKTTLPEYLTDDYPFYVNPLPNTYFTRDSSISIGSGVIFSNMTMEARKREPILLRYIYQYSSHFKNSDVKRFYDNNLPYGIEGGDVLVLSDKAVCIGFSERTSVGAIEYVSSKLLESGFEAVYVFDLEKNRNQMHLDGMLTMIDYDKFIVNPFLDGNANVYKISKDAAGQLKVDHFNDKWDVILRRALAINSVDLIKCGNGDLINGIWELWNLGSNVLTLSPGKVVCYSRNDVTIDTLLKKGIEVKTFDHSELSRGRGGARCMSMPLVRESVKW